MDEANRKRIIVGWAVALSLIAFLPIFLFQYPGLQDYPNHLARAYILQNLDDPTFKHYFSVDYSPVPNLAGTCLHFRQDASSRWNMWARFSSS